MKIFRKAIYILGIAAALAGCRKSPLDQTSLSSFQPEDIFSVYDLSRAAVDGIYEAYVVTTAYRSDYMMYYGANTDIEFWISNGTDERSAMCKYRILPTNSYVNYANANYFYAAVFNSIERANICIKNLRLYGEVKDRKEMAALLRENVTGGAGTLLRDCPVPVAGKAGAGILDKGGIPGYGNIDEKGEVWVCSFVGFFPSYEPKYTLCVTLYFNDYPGYSLPALAFGDIIKGIMDKGLL